MTLLELQQLSNERAALTLARMFAEPVHCPYCNAVCCYLRNELLYQVQGDHAGAPHSETPNANVVIRCSGAHPKGTWMISGQAVIENIRHGRHSLPMR